MGGGIQSDYSYSAVPPCLYENQAISMGIINPTIYRCLADDVLTPEKVEYISRLFKALNDSISSYFQVHQIDFKKQVAAGKYCGDAKFESSYTIPSDTDFHIMVLSHPYSTPGVLAYAASCSSTSDYLVNRQRPVLGYVNVVTKQLKLSEDNFRDQLGVVFHECMHAMGFDGDLAVDKQVGDLNLRVITDEIVVSRARKHFNCPNMSYVPLEDGGGSGTAGSHWERRLFISEIMNGIASTNPRVSEFTLAYFEAMLVYKVNYDQADAFSWGRNEGCSFLYNCSEWRKQNGYRCMSGVRRCTNDRSGVGVCDGNTFKETLNSSYQHYGSPNIGGNDEIADNCIFVSSLSSGSCFKSVSPLTMDYYIGTEMLNHGQGHGPNALCFESSLIKAIPFGISNSHCYNVSCFNNSYYKVSVDGKYYTCKDRLYVRGFGGLLECADPKDICGVTGVTDWPEVESVSQSVVQLDTEVVLYGTHLDNVVKVEHMVVFKVDYRDPYVKSVQFKVSLQVYVNETVNSCYDDFITLDLPIKYMFLNLGDWTMKNYIFFAVFPVWIIAICMLIGYGVLSRVVERQMTEIVEVRKEINDKLNRSDPSKKKKRCCNCCCEIL
ncbi:hypothetical protein EIN_174510 [Entamoeba invadens IP1]|uniref:Uncharacterized protein n=1 Tax=Entamoeba invadens IP1 TaxID=370355 RepID=A0A0A1TW87_ENTIV|nr:hypothetical protein EIN_174510 [Entamoeba invadens IP1]ELP84756.1 hypothetical protein EIN_174510 [Entamoeba invadens IP1]|eukprot:XP_004184102.1 hypothetical protein EIN_174510 [Entamoeba invadens IP1]